jgi:hypothetical protein
MEVVVRPFWSVATQSTVSLASALVSILMLGSRAIKESMYPEIEVLLGAGDGGVEVAVGFAPQRRRVTTIFDFPWVRDRPTMLRTSLHDRNGSTLRRPIRARLIS